jgi:thioredoxin-related protein
MLKDALNHSLGKTKKHLMPSRLKFAVCFLIIIVSAISFKSIKLSEAEGVFFREGNWAEVSHLAHNMNKPIFIFVGAPYCYHSDRLEELFKDKEVGRYFNNKFICKKMDTRNVLNNFRASNWGVNTVPTILFMNANHKIIHKFSGKCNKEQLFDQAILALKKMDTK